MWAESFDKVDDETWGCVNMPLDGIEYVISGAGVMTHAVVRLYAVVILVCSRDGRQAVRCTYCVWLHGKEQIVPAVNAVILGLKIKPLNLSETRKRRNANALAARGCRSFFAG